MTKRKPLNMLTARAEAKRRWGRLGFAKKSRAHKCLFLVGYWKPFRGDLLDIYMGQSGKSWEDAFTNANLHPERRI